MALSKTRIEQNSEMTPAAKFLISALVLTVSLAAPGETRVASDAVPPARMQQYADLAVDWMRQYLQIDTTNPPGNELRAAQWFKKILDQEGIENRLFEYQPGRGNIWARVPATSAKKKRPLILLSHEDVVSSDASHWTFPPFSGAVSEGRMYGRGAQDMKCEGVAQLLALVMLKREKVALERDVILLATADEEVDDTGTDWIIEHQRDLLGNSEFLITEGGENPLVAGRVKFVGIDVAEKAPFWLHVVARGRPGHGSRPILDSAPNRLVRALDRIVAWHTPMRVLPVTEQFLSAMAAHEPPARARLFRNIRQAIHDKKAQQQIEQDYSLNYLLRDTISLTMLGGSPQTNVIPGEAWANLDVRLLPGSDPKLFLEQIRKVVADPDVSIEPLKGFKGSNASPIETPLMAAIRKISAHYFPGTPVVPRLSSGYTENERFRKIGVVSYGYSPYTATPEEGASEHGDNERIRLEELRRGFRIMYDVVNEVAATK
ncbi:MAG: M20/M25/M40 family metallo-hydrolase [Rudaea sp.]